MKGSNDYSYGKCYNAGKIFKRDRPDISWMRLVTCEEFKQLRIEKGLTDKQVRYIKLGYTGKPFEEEDEQEDLMPFGKYKGQPMSSLSPKYLRWLLEQNWISQWPSVNLYAKRKIEEQDSNKVSKEEVAKIFEGFGTNG